MLTEKFDIVYTSIGVLCWLNDLRTWAEIIAFFLKPGGFCYIADGHPFKNMFDNDHPEELQLMYNYFHNPVPMEFIAEGSYASDAPHMNPHKEYKWEHSVSEIINSLIQAGLRIDFFNEYPFSTDKEFEFSEKDSEGYYRLKKQKSPNPQTLRLTVVHFIKRATYHLSTYWTFGAQSRYE